MDPREGGNTNQSFCATISIKVQGSVQLNTVPVRYLAYRHFQQGSPLRTTWQVHALLTVFPTITSLPAFPFINETYLDECIRLHLDPLPCTGDSSGCAMQKLMQNSFGANQVSDPIAVTFWRSRVLLEAIIERQKSSSWLGRLKLKDEESSAASDLGKSLAKGERLISRKFKELKLTGAFKDAPDGTLQST